MKKQNQSEAELKTLKDFPPVRISRRQLKTEARKWIIFIQNNARTEEEKKFAGDVVYWIDNFFNLENF